jgi:PEP-CTERM/exosortase A-associated glycosyltransferase
VRILHVLDHSLPEQSGYSFRSHAILLEQRNLGWEIVAVTSPKQGRTAARLEAVDGVDYHRTGEASGWLGRLPAFDQLEVIRQLRRRLKELIVATRPDLVQAHSPSLNALAALGLGPPLVYELRSSWEDAAVSSGTTREGSLRYRASRALETYVLHRADAITTICNGLRNDVISRGIRADHITVVPNAVDAGGLTRRLAVSSNLRARFNLEKRFVLGFIGSFFAWEGLPLLVDTLPRILAARPDVRLLLVGTGVDEPAIRARVLHHGLDEIVILAGRLQHEEVTAAYDAVDILVYPRTPMRLTELVTPLKPLEAMALGKALIASDVGGHRELIDDGVTGVLFRAGDSAALAAAVLRLAADGALRRALEVAGPRFVREQRTWAQVVPRYAPVYRSLLQNARVDARTARI